jgi:hypothetical protein
MAIRMSRARVHIDSLGIAVTAPNICAINPQKLRSLSDPIGLAIPKI